METQTWICVDCDNEETTPWGAANKPSYCIRCGRFSRYEAAAPATTRPGNLTAGVVPDARRIRLGILKHRHREPMRGLSKETVEVLGWVPDLQKHEIKVTIVGSYGTRKSTTALLLGADLAKLGCSVLYVSLEMGAESSMLGSVASRYSIPDDLPLDVVSIFDMVKLLTIVREEGYKVVIFDSINLMPEVDAIDFSRFSREGQCSLFLICQETKAGLPAGSNKIQHDADIVLNFYRNDDPRSEGKKWAFKVIKHRFDHAGRVGEIPWFTNEAEEIRELTERQNADAAKEQEGEFK